MLRRIKYLTHGRQAQKIHKEKENIHNASNSQITSPKAYHMLGSASTKASVSNQVSFRWKIEVPRVEVFLGGVAAKQDKGLPARAEEERGNHHQNNSQESLQPTNEIKAFKCDEPAAEFLTIREKKLLKLHKALQ